MGSVQTTVAGIARDVGVGPDVVREALTLLDERLPSADDVAFRTRSEVVLEELPPKIALVLRRRGVHGVDVPLGPGWFGVWRDQLMKLMSYDDEREDERWIEFARLLEDILEQHALSSSASPRYEDGAVVVPIELDGRSYKLVASCRRQASEEFDLQAALTRKIRSVPRPAVTNAQRSAASTSSVARTASDFQPVIVLSLAGFTTGAAAWAAKPPRKVVLLDGDDLDGILAQRADVRKVLREGLAAHAANP